MSEAISAVTGIEREHREVKEWTLTKTIYVSLMGFNLLSFLWLLTSGSSIEMPSILWLARLVTVPLAIYLGRLWKDTGFRILAIYTLLIFLRCFIPNPNNIFNPEFAENFLSTGWLFASCYGLAKIVSYQQLRKILWCCTSIWIAAMTILCCLGIYVAWTEETIKLLGTAEIQIYLDSRLNLAYLATVSGAYVGTTIMLTMLCAAGAGKKTARIIFVLCLIPQILALALTDSRTAFISIPAGLAVMVFSAVFHRLQVSAKAGIKRGGNWKAWTFGIMAMMIMFVLLIWGILQVTPLFNQVKIRGIIPRAYAEEAKRTVMATRGFSNHLLSGRSELWESMFSYLREHPLALLIGESKIEPIRQFDHYYAHLHSIYFQVLVESGIPGLLLMLSFIMKTAAHGMRAIQTPGMPKWLRLLPAIPAAIWVEDIVECFSWLRASQCMMSSVLFISAGILCAYTSSHKAKGAAL